jgi:hypothetical protein
MIALVHPADMSRNSLLIIGVCITSMLQAMDVLNAERFVNKRLIKFF